MGLDLTVDTGVYPLEAVMGTAYVFIDRCYVLLDKPAEGKVRVTFEPKPGTDAAALAALAGEFQNELLGQALRLQIALRHEKTREAIVARALFGAAPRMPEVSPPPELPTDAQLGLDPQHLPAENDDYLDDPLGIAVPWEEKFGAKKPEKPEGTP